MWVGGSKPGRIEFLGETKFAPGEWAGVVLDEPVGKNDGSVGGVSYFKVITLYINTRFSCTLRLDFTSFNEHTSKFSFVKKNI